MTLHNFGIKFSYRTYDITVLQDPHNPVKISVAAFFSYRQYSVKSSRSFNKFLCKNDYFDTNIFYVEIHFRSIPRASQSQNAIFILFGCLKIHYTRGIRNRDLKVIKRSRSKSVTFINSPQNLESPLYTKINYFIDSMHSIRNHDLKVI